MRRYSSASESAASSLTRGAYSGRLIASQGQLAGTGVGRMALQEGLAQFETLVLSPPHARSTGVLGGASAHAGAAYVNAVPSSVQAKLGSFGAG